MVRTTIQAEDNNLVIPLAKNYIGKKLEVIYYALDEITEEQPVKSNTIGRFRGLLTSDEAGQLQNHLQKSREEWDRDF